MYFYKHNNVYYACNKPLSAWEQITEKEYLAATTPTEEEIRAEKEAQFKRLMNELYPVED